jgi:archaellum biogenesis protein FlaJ (TadC family)
MLSFYRWLLYLYPSLFRREYADEMISVFRDAQAEVSAGSFGERISFRMREAWGLLAGALQENIRIMSGSYQSISFTRFNMRPEFRFPLSTVFLMSIIFVGVILAMEKANTIQMKYADGVGSIWPSLPWFFGLTILFTCATVMVVWGILFALGRSGVHRLANILPGANRTD